MKTKLTVKPTNNNLRPENRRMMAFLTAAGYKGIRAMFIRKGSMRGVWRLYLPNVNWSMDEARKLAALGFRDFDDKPLHCHAGNGGAFQVFVLGHNEFLTQDTPVVAPAQSVVEPKPVTAMTGGHPFIPAAPVVPVLVILHAPPSAMFWKN